MYGTIPEYIEFLQMILWGVGMYLIGYYIFKKSKNRIMQKI